MRVEEKVGDHGARVVTRTCMVTVSRDACEIHFGLGRDADGGRRRYVELTVPMDSRLPGPHRGTARGQDMGRTD